MPAGLMTLPTEAETLLRRCSGFQSISAIFLIACAANFGVVMLKNTSAPVDLSLTIWLSIGGLGRLVALLGDDHRGGLVAEPVLQALQVVLAVIVVLVEHRDLGVGLLLQQVLRRRYAPSLW